MPRGQLSAVGATMISQNGYSHTRTVTGWRPTHHLIAELAIGRPLTKLDLVKFKDGDKTNLDPSNIIVVARKTRSANAQLAKLYAQRAEIDAEIQRLESSKK